ncbi:MAG: hypothetical protein GXY49_07090 [Syntrophomonadaceae bacterium]|nr:hypothetical protein [Syntrophomonadaceae bacterium]
MPVTALLILSLITFVLPEKSIPTGEKTQLQIQEPQSQVTYQVIGYSYLDTAIKSYTIAPPNYNKTMLLTFAMHGYENGWDKDGAALVQIANDVINEFAGSPGELKETRLIVIPCVNPDGLEVGQSSCGFGRCNAQGIDINRDFDYYWQYCSAGMYRTGNAPFSTPEAQILRDVVLKEQPDIIIDFHGWLSCSYGDAALTDYFNKAFNTRRQRPNTMDNTYMAQFFAGWASQYARSALLEYPDPKTMQNMIDLKYSQKTINIIRKICSEI